MSTNPILELPLHHFMRSEIALTLQHVLKLHTVGNLVHAWKNPRTHRSIEDVFDSPEQARNAVATCAAWLGTGTVAADANPVAAWWSDSSGTGILPVSHDAALPKS